MIYAAHLFFPIWHTANIDYACTDSHRERERERESERERERDFIRDRERKRYWNRE